MPYLLDNVWVFLLLLFILLKGRKSKMNKHDFCNIQLELRFSIILLNSTPPPKKKLTELRDWSQFQNRPYTDGSQNFFLMAWLSYKYINTSLSLGLSPTRQIHLTLCFTFCSCQYAQKLGKFHCTFTPKIKFTSWQEIKTWIWFSIIWYFSQ